MDVADYFRLRDAAVLAGGQEVPPVSGKPGQIQVSGAGGDHAAQNADGDYHDARGNEGGLEGVAGGERASVRGLGGHLAYGDLVAVRNFRVAFEVHEQPNDQFKVTWNVNTMPGRHGR